MKQLALLVFSMLLSLSVLAADESKEKPTQHLKIADVNSMEEAKEKRVLLQPHSFQDPAEA